MNEVNYFSKCPKYFLNKYFFNKSVQKNPVIVVKDKLNCCSYSLSLVYNVVQKKIYEIFFPVSEKKDSLQFNCKRIC